MLCNVCGVVSSIVGFGVEMDVEALFGKLIIERGWTVASRGAFDMGMDGCRWI